MLSSSGFDLWADGYDKSVGLSEEENAYPFAGYKDVLGRVYAAVSPRAGLRVLDIGFGTGVLTAALDHQGCEVWGVDFSSRMIELARERMPSAHLYRADFSKGLPREITECRFDAIVSTYALHHLSAAEKAAFLASLLPLLAPGGRILVGDVSVGTRAALEACRRESGEEWDDEECYMVYEQEKAGLPGHHAFEPVSFCAGILSVRP